MRTPALLLVDVIKALFDPAGIWWYPAVAEVTGPLEKLLAAARMNDRLVVHATQLHRPGFSGLTLDRAEPGTREFTETDWKPAEGFEPDGTRPTEILLPKRSYSAFFATDLDVLLRERHVDTLVIGGVKTNVCVRATVQDAVAHGYQVVVPREATNSNRPHLAAAALEDVEHYFGEVVTLDEALRRL
jgi:nicotinamidase-related amidase